MANLLRSVLSGKAQEECHVLLLDTRDRLICDETVTLGLADRSQFHPREVLRAAIAANCSRIILVHNHPTGDATPSPQDIVAIRQIAEVGRIVGTELADHTIPRAKSVSRDRNSLSLRQAGKTQP